MPEGLGYPAASQNMDPNMGGTLTPPMPAKEQAVGPVYQGGTGMMPVPPPPAPVTPVGYIGTRKVPY